MAVGSLRLVFRRCAPPFVRAEAEGGLCAEMFDRFLDLAEERGISFVPPGELIPADRSQLPVKSIVQEEIPGREGTLAVVR